MFIKIIFSLALLLSIAPAPDVSAAQKREVTRMPVMPKDLEWANVERPPHFKHLRKKFVLFYFWTYDNLHSVNLLEDIDLIKRKFPDKVVLIGVHSPKFTKGQQIVNVKEAILKYNVHIPVIHDPDRKVWTLFDVHAWPTIVLIGPDGKVVHRNSGLGAVKSTEKAIEESLLLQYKNRVHPKDIKFKQNVDVRHGSFLSFPTKLFADAAGGQLYIADSGNNRVVVTDFAGNIVEIIGSGKAAILDGSFDSAAFKFPQGIAKYNGKLYVADTGNHAIREIDPETRSVKTIAGNGRPSYRIKPEADAGKAKLHSPTGLVVLEDILMIAMAGTNQIWAIDLKSNAFYHIAGSGYWNMVDGKLVKSALAQPMDITSDGKNLYFVDGQSSSVRKCEPTLYGQIDTIIGQGLFDFGDLDGNEMTGRLQFPTGIAYGHNMLWVADTFNNKIRVVDPNKKTIVTFLGGEAGHVDGNFDEARFNDPSGLSVMNDQIFVADTHNHVIRVIDITEQTVATFFIRGNGAQTAEKESPTTAFMSSRYDERVLVDPISHRIGDGRIVVRLPRRHFLLKNPPSNLKLITSNGDILVDMPVVSRKISFKVRRTLPVELLHAELDLNYCKKLKKQVECFTHDVVFDIPITKGKKSQDIRINYTVKDKEE